MGPRLRARPVVKGLWRWGLLDVFPGSALGLPKLGLLVALAPSVYTSRVAHSGMGTVMSPAPDFGTTITTCLTLIPHYNSSAFTMTSMCSCESFPQERFSAVVFMFRGHSDDDDDAAPSG